jgi:hypothetical protein
MANPETAAIGYYAKYPFKNFNRENKEIIYEGLAIEAPAKLLKEHTNIKKEHKFIIIYIKP